MEARVCFLANMQGRQAYWYPSRLPRFALKALKGSAVEHWKHHLCSAGTGAGMMRRGMVRMAARDPRNGP